jgi:hypothetical protein
MKNVVIFNKITRARNPDDKSRHKDIIELTRINQRSQYRARQEPFYDLVYKPDKNSPHFPNYDPLKDKDFNEADKETRKAQLERHKRIVHEKAIFHLKKEANAWDNTNQAFDDRIFQINQKREVINNACSNRSHGFNIINQRYEPSREGSNLLRKDQLADTRLQNRSHTLYAKNNASYDILTGIAKGYIKNSKEAAFSEKENIRTN